jgi:hypothetical protein
LRQRPGLQADPRQIEAERGEPADQHFRLTDDFRLSKIFPAPSTTRTLDASKDTSIPA